MIERIVIEEIVREQERKWRKGLGWVVAFLVIWAAAILAIGRFTPFILFVTAFATASLFGLVYLWTLPWDWERLDLLEHTRANWLIEQQVSGLQPWQPPIPLEELEKKKSRFSFSLPQISFGLLVIGLYFLSYRFFPQQADMISAISLLMLGMAWLYLFPSKEGRARTSLILKEVAAKRDRPGKKEEQNWMVRGLARLQEIANGEDEPWPRQLGAGIVIGGMLIGLTCLVVVVMDRFFSWSVELFFDWLLAVLGSLTAVVVVVFGSILLLCLLLYLSEKRPLFRVKHSLNRGRYSEALEQAKVLGRGDRLFLTGMILMYAGRYGEAEQTLRENLEAARDAASFKRLAAILDNLGRVVAAQGRVDEAIGVLEAAVRLWPAGPGAYTTLAGVHLLRGDKADKAAWLSQTALRFQLRTVPLALLMEWHLVGEALANLAWARAQSGQMEGARAALCWAFLLSARYFRPSLAGIHFRAGQVKQAGGDVEAAVSHYISGR